MSVDLHVYLSRSRMPSAEQWSTAVRDAGYSAYISQDFDVEKHAGFLPCEYEGKDSGFEYYAGALNHCDIEDMELEPNEKALFRTFDFSVLISVKSRQARDHKTANIFAACLAKLSGGLLHDPQCALFFSGQNATEALDEILQGIDLLNTNEDNAPSNASTVVDDTWFGRLHRCLKSILQR